MRREETEGACITLYCHHQNNSCIKRDSCVSNFNVSLTVQERSHNQCSAECCITSIDIILKTIRDEEPRAAASTFTQLLSSERLSMNHSF